MKVQSKLAIFVSSTTIIFYTILTFVLGTNAIIAATKTANRQNTVNYASYPKTMFDLRYHDIGLLYLPITNYGIHGHEINLGGAGGIWPIGSGQSYIFAAGIWVGAIKNG